MLYKGKDEVEPAESNPFKLYDQTTSYDKGRGRGSHESGEGCIQCNPLSNYLSSITYDDDNHLIPLSIKVAEAEVEEDVDVEDKTLHAATDNKSADHPILNSQGSVPTPK